MKNYLRTITSDQLKLERTDPIDDKTLSIADEIIKDVKHNGEIALKNHAERLGDIKHGDKLIYAKQDLEKSLHDITHKERELLERTAKRIKYSLKPRETQSKKLSLKSLEVLQVKQSLPWNEPVAMLQEADSHYLLQY
jgi:histidinol dehydrogenase